MASYQTSTAGPSRPYPGYPQQNASGSPTPSPPMDQNQWPANGHQYANPGSMQMPQPRGVSGSSSSSVSRSASAASGHGSTITNDSSEGSKRNPLIDLMDSEKVYVDQLSLVIRKVAAAWSRKDFPPPKLDSMFRCIEAVYRANRSFGSKLKEIGPNPSSPKALGDLLMRWIDDLEPSYNKYCSNFLTGFDSYQPVTKNQLLNGILQEISLTNKPTPPLNQWSLDALFILPYTRLRYYRKLYVRLLRSTKEGRSDHKLLVVANQKLDDLVNQIESRLELDVSENDTDNQQQQQQQQDGQNNNRVSGNGSLQGSSVITNTQPNSREQSWAEKERISRTSSGMDSSIDSSTNSRIEDRDSGGSALTNMTNITQSPQRKPQISVTTNNTTTSSGSVPTTATAPLSDLEMRIDPERTIDLFSMTPKKCKLQMNPPTLPFTRTLRSSHDVTVYFTPNSTGQPVVHQRAHIFILSDLFLVAEWMEAAEKASKAQQVAREQPDRVGHGGPMPEMWLSYPPLAGKHLMVAEGQQANVLSIMIMKRETFVIHAESDIARDQIMKDLIDCIDFASVATRPSTAAPSPINPPDPRSPSVNSNDNRSVDSTFPPLRHPSPFSNSSSPSTSPRPNEQAEMPPMPLGGNALVSQMSQMSLQPGEAIAWPRGPAPPQAMPTPHNQQTNNSPAPGGAPTMAVLPPRGASLRPRVQSNNMQSPTQPHAPQIPPMPGMAFNRPSDLQIPIHGSGSSAAGAPLPRSPSGRSVQSAPRPNMDNDLPPVPSIRPSGSHMSDQGHHGLPSGPMPPFAQNQVIARSRSLEPLRAPEPPSARFSSFENTPINNGNGGIGRSSPLTGLGPDNDHQDSTMLESPIDDDDEEDDQKQDEEEITSLTGPTVISAQMKCKIFLKQEHQKWKSLGSGKLKLYLQKQGPPLKQLVVENDSNSKSQIIISTIVLTDGVERVAKTGVAIEISDKGKRTGIIYMIQLRNEKSAMGLFESLLQGSDRAINR
ncbi:uncharacterized protein L201_002120 [Kwoniella dendrophila CBS 6074]|uniref:DH domain-containing protein n=1 Tax=Kwoniella dendrophila CBS 6074 TaxID=1295534 RepID=A0AAX4JPB0_9TREE